MQINQFILLMVLVMIFNESVLARTCESSDLRHAQEIQGEVAGRNTFKAQVHTDLIFSLEPSMYGWSIRLRDKENMDLSQITAPFHVMTNPRDISGWHFRNAANTSKNTGDVNAPQHLRLFEFSTSLTGTGGFRPPKNSPKTIVADSSHGRGALNILDMGLTDLEPGQKARINYLKFQVCVTWPKTKQQIIDTLNNKNPQFLDEEINRMLSCGLDAKKYQLTAWILPRWFDGDFDGDDTIDEVAPIIRKTDGRKGIAICRAGTWLSIIGFRDSDHIPLQTKAGEPRTERYFSLGGYLESLEYWKMDHTSKGNDRLILGRIEKAELAVFWADGIFNHELLWVFVEP